MSSLMTGSSCLLEKPLLDVSAARAVETTSHQSSCLLLDVGSLQAGYLPLPLSSIMLVVSKCNWLPCLFHLISYPLPYTIILPLAQTEEEKDSRKFTWRPKTGVLSSKYSYYVWEYMFSCLFLETSFVRAFRSNIVGTVTKSVRLSDRHRLLDE